MGEHARPLLVVALVADGEVELLVRTEDEPPAVVGGARGQAGITSVGSLSEAADWS